MYVFRNDYKISGGIVFLLSFVLKNLILVIKHNRKVMENLGFSI